MPLVSDVTKVVARQVSRVVSDETHGVEKLSAPKLEKAVVPLGRDVLDLAGKASVDSSAAHLRSSPFVDSLKPGPARSRPPCAV